MAVPFFGDDGSIKKRQPVDKMVHRLIHSQAEPNHRFSRGTGGPRWHGHGRVGKWQDRRLVERIAEPRTERQAKSTPVTMFVPVQLGRSMPKSPPISHADALRRTSIGRTGGFGLRVWVCSQSLGTLQHRSPSSLGKAHTASHLPGAYITWTMVSHSAAAGS